jgi:hypothetical protein
MCDVRLFRIIYYSEAVSKNTFETAFSLFLLRFASGFQPSQFAMMCCFPLRTAFPERSVGDCSSRFTMTDEQIIQTLYSQLNNTVSLK